MQWQAGREAKKTAVLCPFQVTSQTLILDYFKSTGAKYNDQKWGCRKGQAEAEALQIWKEL